MKPLLLVGLPIVILGLWFVSPFAADQDIEKGEAAYVSGDYSEALKNFSPLAEQGDATAQFFLGVMYALGQGVPQDDQEAVKWYRIAAEQGHDSSQYDLGVMYGKGQGVPQDDRQAVKWYRLAAEQGNDMAQYNLGVMYALGRGVAQDLVQGHMWMNLASIDGDVDRVKARDELADVMTAEQIAEAQRLSREWKPKRDSTSQ